MANAILRDVLSTTKKLNLNSAKCHKETDNTISTTTNSSTSHSTINNNCTKTTHRLVDFVCSCVCHHPTKLSADSPHLIAKLLPVNTTVNNNKNNTTDLNDETLDLRNSYTSSEDCLRSNCPIEYFKFRTIETFSNLNISSSTAFENTSNEEVTDADTPQTPPREYNANFRALGILQEKRSPLFGPALNTPSGGVSLRSQKPYYTQRILKREDLILSSKSVKRFKENIDNTATEAISMNGGKQLNNGPLGTFTKSNSTGRVGNGGIDINRNNGAPRNWTVMTSSSTEKREHLYKILVIGELGTGKTSFIKRYVHQFFSQNYRATIGVDFALKVLHWDPNTIVRLQLWDIAGQERFGNMTRVYYKEAVGAFIVFDVTRSGTFDCVSKWKEDLDSKVQLPDGSPIPCILLANKCDQDKQGVVTNTEKMDEYVKEHGFAGWFETSAKENINIDEAARALVNKILLNDKLISAADLADSEKFNLNNTGDQTALDGKNKCSC
ncbi:Ras-related protein Rab-32 [Lucilia cuprina]|nr:Ras-related protein Rab-32 [Lucilia cuprina]KAI8117160.1 Ras-related protein Rab-32 [Lucilia cuprina]